jgi:hypothetical protein
MWTAVLAFIGLLLSSFGDSKEDSSDAAIDNIGTSGSDGEGSFLDSVGGYLGRVGEGLSDIELTGSDVTEFTIQKEIGSYSGVGVGSRGLVGAVADGTTGFVKQVGEFISTPLGTGLLLLGGFFVVKKIFFSSPSQTVIQSPGGN